MYTSYPEQVYDDHERSKYQGLCGPGGVHNWTEEWHRRYPCLQTKPFIAVNKQTTHPPLDPGKVFAQSRTKNAIWNKHACRNAMLHVSQLALQLYKVKLSSRYSTKYL